MRSPKSKTQNVRTTGAPVADASRRLKSAPPPDYSSIDPSATVTIGRELLGHLVDGDRQCVALTPAREFIGIFPSRKSAVLAILLHPRADASLTNGKPPDG
jgi:hypothetical protein